ncbi:MAG TPA: DUF177 domain-containing protein [Gemmatimonadaceae bacterium]|nr:DUF177 domain-containing protein [Gemmatimonadaceae bacterium]
MLSFDLRSLESHPVQVAGELAPDDSVWQEGDPRPDGSVSVTGRVSKAGPGRFYFHGRMAGSLRAECRRCLGDVAEEIEDEMHLIFAEEGDADTADDPDVYLIDPRANDLDLRPALREQWLLLAPSYSLCSEDCKGLCPTCGADRNVADCDCAERTDSRWDALRGAKGGHPKH